jgi:hypothetical protein
MLAWIAASCGGYWPGPEWPYWNSAERTDWVVEQYTAGATACELADQTHCSASTVYRALLVAGSVPPTSTTAPSRPPHISANPWSWQGRFFG